MKEFTKPHLPDVRERRARILWLITAVLVVSAPHMLHISPWIIALLTGICMWRYMLEIRNWKLPSAWVKVPLVFIGLAAVVASYRSITGVEAGTALLLVMLALKMLETKNARDLTVVSAICWFLMFAVFLREQEIWGIPYLLIGIWLCITALLQIRRAGPLLPFNEALRQTGGLLLQAAPLMLVLFFLFPRLPAPFWAISTGGSSGQTGLSDQVSPGDISSLSRSDAVAFRVRFKDAVPPPDERYWRGPVMGYFNGRSWSWLDRGEKLNPDDALTIGGTHYDYELMLEPHGREWLLALDVPVAWSRNQAYLSADLQLINKGPIRQRLAYTARSYQAVTKTGSEHPRHLNAMTHLPGNSNPRAVEFARQLRAETADDREFLNRVLVHFRQQEFYYTLQPPKLGSNPVDEFLFDTRKGFCEHYASTFAVLARAAGIPTRLVTGYLGGELNGLNNDWIVRQSDAHAWNEVWLDGRWVRFDPTAAVAPERVELGLDEALSDADLSLGRNLRNTIFISQALLSWDAVNAAWNRWVLAFGPDTQRALLKNLGIPRPDMRDLILIMVAGISILLALLAWYLRASSVASEDPLRRTYDQFCNKLAKAGITIQSGEAPADYCRRVVRQLPALKNEIESITGLYLKLRYENLISKEQQRNFEQQVRQFSARA